MEVSDLVDAISADTSLVYIDRPNNPTGQTLTLAEVEQILARFNTQQMDVDMLAAEVKRATELIAQCKERLVRAEREVAEVLGTEEGSR